ncbi:BCCT family transporter [Bacillus sp. FSL W7-1360]
MKQITTVFYVSLSIAIAFILWGAIAPTNMKDITETIQKMITSELGWFYLLSATFYVGVGIYLIFSPYGKIKLGKPDEEPEYNYLTWFAFLFTAGMGIGLVFWGAAEPLSHFFSPPYAAPETKQAAAEAMRYSIFHWGIHPWAIYAVVALTLAYFQYRKDEPALFSSTFRPLIGHRVTGPIGKLIDVFVVFATVFGTATSLGFGAAQITAGIRYVFPQLQDFNVYIFQVVVIVIVTILFSLSAATGIDKGIRILSNLNVRLAIILMTFILFLGPTSHIMGVFTQGIGSYAQNFFGMSFAMDIYDPKSSWVQDWTIFYWAWWISWAPFVSAFIARVSRGRTIREFVIGVIALPSLFGTLWFSVFGGSSLYFESIGRDLYSHMQESGTEMALFSLLEQFPLTFVISIIAVLLICSFFITSADSATVVLGMQTTGGNLNPPGIVKFIWGLIISGTATVLLITGGKAGTGLTALQTASIIGAFPFAVIIILMIVSLFKELRSEKAILVVDRERVRQERLALRTERERVRREQHILKREQQRFKKEKEKSTPPRKND